MSMQANINLIIKSIIFLTLITLALYFLYFGYNELNKADIKIKSKSNIRLVLHLVHPVVYILIINFIPPIISDYFVSLISNSRRTC